MASNSAPNPGFHSESAASQTRPPLKEEQDVSSGQVELLQPKEEHFEELEYLENREKYEKYATEMTSYLTNKYFSDKTIFGGNIYDVKVNSDGQTVKASRLPPYQSFADPASFHGLLESVVMFDGGALGDASNEQQSGKN
ncbi:hypothetical protein ACH5RR_025102 [Cinchona calisaya]|uniref:Uncharacterized protein n=1 Tax=Cinchona calisaya TaxID=153742 RepID=A0ABD2Z209_9GENT